MNTLKAEFGVQVRAMLKQIRENKAIRGLVFISAKPDNFIAGADINMIARAQSALEAEELARQGQQVMSEINSLPIPVIAAIHGACLGGGLELALACHSRICTDDAKTILGLPEVQLGLLPGSGGTQRLPRLVGVSTALEMILTGKQLRARQALKAGLVDDVVPQSILLEAAVELALKGRQAKRPLPVRERVLAGPLGRTLLFNMVGKKTEQKTKGNYPAAKRILDVIETGLSQGSSSGYAAEAKAFGELAMTPQSQALRSIFFASNDVKKIPAARRSLRLCVPLAYWVGGSWAAVSLLLPPAKANCRYASKTLTLRESTTRCSTAGRTLIKRSNAAISRQASVIKPRRRSPVRRITAVLRTAIW